MSKRKDVAWRESELVKNYLEGFRGLLPLAEEQLDIMLRLIRSRGGPVQVFVDIGCGDGILGATILEHYPDAKGIFLDFSQPMLDAAHEKLRAFENQCEFLDVDYSTKDWVSSVKSHGPFDVIVSGYSIHHQPDPRKRELYSEFYDLLGPGGLFVNVEHVASESDNVESLFEQYLIDFLYNGEVKRRGKRTREQVALDFYNTREDKEANLLTKVEDQCGWLREIGFQDVDCYFKVFELAVFGGRRSNPHYS